MRRHVDRVDALEMLIDTAWWIHQVFSEARGLRSWDQLRTWLRVMRRLAPWQSRRQRRRAAHFLTWMREQPGRRD